VKELNLAFKRIPLLQDYQPADFKIQRLPGLTNHTFHLKNPQVDWVVRIPKADTNSYIDRKAEAINSEIAMQLGLAPDCVWRDDEGLSLTRTLRHTQSLTALDICNPEILSLILQKLNILHSSKQSFHGYVNPEALLKRYFSLIPDTQQALIHGDFSNALQCLTIIDNKDRTLTPSHNDLVLQNLLLDTNRQLWFIDWEYSSMASPYWDLATLCNAADFDSEQSENLLNIYHQQQSSSDIELLMNYRYVLKVLSQCWMMAFNLDSAAGRSY
jgi:thiamine kinase-like enzyme